MMGQIWGQLAPNFWPLRCAALCKFANAGKWWEMVGLRGSDKEIGGGCSGHAGAAWLPAWHPSPPIGRAHSCLLIGWGPSWLGRQKPGQTESSPGLGRRLTLGSAHPPTPGSRHCFVSAKANTALLTKLSKARPGRVDQGRGGGESRSIWFSSLSFPRFSPFASGSGRVSTERGTLIALS